MTSIRDLLSYRIHKLAGAMSRGAAARYRAEFGVTLMEWRALALLGDGTALSLQELARHAALDKSQISRVVSALTARGLVKRGVSKADARAAHISLTPAGARIRAGLLRSAAARDAAFAAVLTAQEQRVLDRVIRKLTEEARRQSEPETWA